MSKNQRKLIAILDVIRIEHHLRRYILLFAIISIFLILLLRNTGLYPVIFGDEYSYSKFSRLLPLTASIYPQYLYLGIYHITSLFGDGFLSAARILNSFFFVAAAPFIYLITKRICNANIALFVMVITLIGPVNSYTAYYMPESLYFFSFWLFVWFFLRLDRQSPMKYWCFAGSLLGVASLVKPHALFLLPAIVIYIFITNNAKESGWLGLAIKNSVFFIAFVLITKLLIGYLLAGYSGLTLFGPSYNAYLPSSLGKIVSSTLFVLKGHVLSISLMYGVPLAIASSFLYQSELFHGGLSNAQKISLFTLLILSSLVLVTSLFTASVAGSNIYETSSRLHMRYYNFALPLLFIIVASQLSLDIRTISLRLRTMIAVPISIAVLYATYTHLSPYKLSFIDNPELRGFTVNSIIFYGLSALSLGALLIWVLNPLRGSQIFIYVFMSLMVISTTININTDLMNRLTSNTYDKAGIFARQFLDIKSASKLLVVGSKSQFAGLLHALFYIDSPTASLLTLPDGEELSLSKIPTNKDWVLVIGNHLLADQKIFKITLNGFYLAYVGRSNIINFKRGSSWQGILYDVQGLSRPEDWGAWSIGGMVNILFTSPLPPRFSLHLVASAFGPNVGRNFIIRVGKVQKTFQLVAQPEERIINLTNSQRSQNIIIKVPIPISPKKIGVSSDERHLGIGLIKLWIVPGV